MNVKQIPVINSESCFEGMNVTYFSPSFIKQNWRCKQNAAPIFVFNSVLDYPFVGSSFKNYLANIIYEMKIKILTVMNNIF